MGHPVTSATFCWLEATHWVQPTLKGRGWHKGVNTRSWESLRAVLELCYYMEEVLGKWDTRHPSLLMAHFCETGKASMGHQPDEETQGGCEEE